MVRSICISKNGYSIVSVNRKATLLHRLIVENVLGGKIPKKARVHHVDGDKTNFSNNNLVLCDSHFYHHLLHRREKALKKCGNANWRKCCYCFKYDDPSKMYAVKTQTRAYHRECYNSEVKKRRKLEKLRTI